MKILKKLLVRIILLILTVGIVCSSVPTWPTWIAGKVR